MSKGVYVKKISGFCFVALIDPPSSNWQKFRVAGVLA
jgi:hypothetical protein